VLVDWGAQFLHLSISGRLYRYATNSNYSVLHAVLFPRTVDLWIRYSDIVKELSSSNKNRSILEVGSGAMGLYSFLHPFDGEFVACDISKKALEVGMASGKVACDARSLPFRSGAFQIVVCADLLEHVPKEERNRCYDEFLRVGLQKLVMHFPAVSTDGEYNARDYDLMFQSFYTGFFGTEHSATKEHIERYHPTIDEIKSEFPGSSIVGSLNSQIWLKYMKLSSLPIWGFIGGMVYALFWKRNSTPPFYKCKVVVDLRKWNSKMT